MRPKIVPGTMTLAEMGAALHAAAHPQRVLSNDERARADARRQAEFRRLHQPVPAWREQMNAPSFPPREGIT